MSSPSPRREAGRNSPPASLLTGAPAGIVARNGNRAPVVPPPEVRQGATPPPRVEWEQRLEQWFPSLFTVKPQEVLHFSRQLATLLDAGISLLPALELLLQQSSGGRGMKRVLRTISEDIASGSSFGAAIGKHRKVFSDIYQRTVTVGERSGNTAAILKQLADYIEQQAQMAKKVKGALTYPILILVVGLGTGIVVTTTALPPLVGMFSQLGTDLPIPTRILMAFTKFLNTYLLHLLGVMGALVVVIIWMLRRPQGQVALDRLKLKTPLLGPALHMRELARVSRAISVMVGASLSLQETMEVVAQISTNRMMRDRLGKVHDGLILGMGLAGPMARLDLFPPLFIQMAAVGEESNSLDFTMGVTANFYEERSEERLAALVGFISPASTMLVSAVAGGIALAVVMPMYAITGSFG